MCGIIGYVGPAGAQNILIESLRRQEYRGYDSAGVVTIDTGKFCLRRAPGKLRELEQLLAKAPAKGNIGIGHTRWATHGVPAERNAHPHICGRIAVVHNGIVENYKQLREKLAKKGSKYSSDTDTEVIAHLIDYYYKDDLLKAVARALSEVKGTYAVAVLDRENPELMIAARQSSPLVIGVGEGENYVASDIPAILKYTRKMILLNDGEIAEVGPNGVKCYRLQDLSGVRRKIKEISWDAEMAKKEGFEHFMLKEIFEQPKAATDTYRGRLTKDEQYVALSDLQIDAAYVRRIKKIVIVACGTSLYAGMVGRVALEQAVRVPVECQLASEFRYSDPFVDRDTLVIVVSQSGETADTLAGLWESHARKARVLSICNVVDSSIARYSDWVLYTQAGPEIGVASTKAFTTQVVVLNLLAMRLGRIVGRHDKEAEAQFVTELKRLPNKLKQQLKQSDAIKKIAAKYKDHDSFLFLGRGINVPIALEGALKLKEISYIHAEGYPAGEMKHGPIALIDETFPVVCIVNKTSTYDKMVSNMEEVKARGGRIIALASTGDKKLVKLANEIITVPRSHPFLEPVLANLPLQLLAYHIANLRGMDVDQPRNLAKSVTVE